MRKAFTAIEFIISIFLCSTLLLILLSFYLELSHKYQKYEKDQSDLAQLINQAEENHYDSCVTQNNNMQLKIIQRGRFSIEYLDKSI